MQELQKKKVNLALHSFHLYHIVMYIFLPLGATLNHKNKYAYSINRNENIHVIVKIINYLFKTSILVNFQLFSYFCCPASQGKHGVGGLIGALLAGERRPFISHCFI